MPPFDPDGVPAGPRKVPWSDGCVGFRHLAFDLGRHLAAEVAIG